MNDDINEILRGDDMLSEIEEGSELYEHVRMTVDPGQQPEGSSLSASTPT